MNYREGLKQANANLNEAMLNMPLGPVMKSQLRTAMVEAFELGASIATDLGEARVERVFKAWKESSGLEEDHG